MPSLNQNPEKLKRKKQLLTALATLYPKCFTLESSAKKPLKIGIADDIIKKFPGISKREVSRILHHYTQKTGYLKKIKKGESRIDLDGNPSGLITEYDQNIAKEKIKSKAIKSAEKKRLKALKRGKFQ